MDKKVMTLLEKTIEIRTMISSDLAFRNNANTFFDEVNNIPFEKIYIDFSGIKSISRSFAHEYSIRKKNSKKLINEINMPENIEKMFRIVNSINDIKEIDYY